MENKTMMKLVVGTESIFFLSLIMSFVYLSYVSGFEPGEQHSLNIRSTGLFTLLLVSSSGTLWLAERSYNRQNIKYLKLWLIATVLLGGLFLVGQASEYLRLIHEQQITISGSLFGTSFYTLTGFHALHVIIGLILLTILFVMTLLGDFEKSGSTVISTAGIYWHFVDIVWIIVFVVVYVFPNTTILK